MNNHPERNSASQTAGPGQTPADDRPKASPGTAPADDRPKAPPGTEPCISCTLPITDLNQEGQGIGRLDGLAVFVNGALPGDLAEIRITGRHSRYATGSLLRLIAPSPLRIRPACPVAARCGGCTLQALDYPAQLLLKRQQVVDALQRIGGFANAPDLVRPVLGMTGPLQPWHYRSKIQLPVAGSSDNPRIGFYAAGSHDVVDTPVCAVQPPVGDAIRDALRDHLRRFHIAPYQESSHTGLVRHLIIRLGFATGDIMVGLVLNGDDLPGQPEWILALQKAIAACHDPELPPLHLTSCYLTTNSARTNLIQTGEIRLIFGQAWIEEQLLGLRYRISPRSFFQVNPRQTEVLYATILRFANMTGQETILDLYCGTGSITLQLARQAKEAVGVEAIADAIDDARINAQINQISNARFITGKAEDITPGLVDSGLKDDLVVVDPPRKGCDRSLIETMIRLQPPRLIYVSCNPATLARDLALLQSSGYQVTDVQPIDLFPWTGHIESVVLISRGEK